MKRDTRIPKKKRGTINVPPSVYKYRYRYILLVRIRTNLLYFCSLVHGSYCEVTALSLIHISEPTRPY